MEYLEQANLEKYARDNGWELSERLKENAVAIRKAGIDGILYFMKHSELGWVMRPSSREVSLALKEKFTNLDAEGFFLASTNVSDFVPVFDFAAKQFKLLAKQNENIVQDMTAELFDGLNILTTEVEAVVKQRRGQEEYRSKLEEYWGNACAVTGIEVPVMLRASHAKPWKDCTSDAERLDPFNGFLLSANLDALFDKGYITFDDAGKLIPSSLLTPAQINQLGLNNLTLRKLDPRHLQYLEYHHREIFKK